MTKIKLNIQGGKMAKKPPQSWIYLALCTTNTFKVLKLKILSASEVTILSECDPQLTGDKMP